MDAAGAASRPGVALPPPFVGQRDRSRSDGHYPPLLTADAHRGLGALHLACDNNHAIVPASATPLLKQLIWVFLAGGVGASLRVVTARWVDDRWAETLPFVGTLLVNMVGCFAIGVAAAVMPAGTARTAVVGGLLGGFTTYSAFALLSYDLLRDDRLGVLLTQVLVHIVLGVICVAIGVSLGRAIVGGTTP